MKLCRFQPFELSARELGRTTHEVHPAPHAGIIEGQTVWEILGDFYGERARTGRNWPLEAVKLLAPAEPTKIVCVGKNYVDHAMEFDRQVPKEPLIFLKPPSSVIGPDEPIVLPRISQRVDYEGELALVIGRLCRHLHPREDLRPYILGWTCLNDVTARDLQRRDGQFTRGKGFDTFCPIGPLISTDLDLASTSVETFVNGKRKQFGRISEMVFSVDVIMRWIAQVMTLVAGDLIATGTPAGVGPLAEDDVVEVVVSGIGTLRNTVLGPED